MTGLVSVGLLTLLATAGAVAAALGAADFPFILINSALSQHSLIYSAERGSDVR